MPATSPMILPAERAATPGIASSAGARASTRPVMSASIARMSFVRLRILSTRSSATDATTLGSPVRRSVVASRGLIVPSVLVWGPIPG